MAVEKGHAFFRLRLPTPPQVSLLQILVQSGVALLSCKLKHRIPDLIDLPLLVHQLRQTDASSITSHCIQEFTHVVVHLV